jgi:competence protein ComEC
MKRTNVVIVGCVFGLAGIYVGRYYDLSFLPLLTSAFIFLTTRKKIARYYVGIAVLALGIGNMRGVAHNQGFEVLRGHFETKVTLHVSSLDDAEYDTRGQLAFNANNIEINGERVPGQIAVSGFGEFSVLRGDTVEVSGKLMQARGSNQARVSFAQLDTVKKDVSWYNKLRRKFIKKLRDNLPEPLSSFASGLLIGQRATIPERITNDLRDAGLAHIIAVSGYNLTIIIKFVMVILKKFSRYQKLSISLLIVGIFLLITGFSASIGRAGIVSSLSLLAWYYGRQFRPAVLLVVSALATALYKPEYIWGDVGWYLSFLAFSGVLIVSPILRQRISPGKELKLLGSTLLETLSVLIMVVPYSMYIFGVLSLTALPANMIVAPSIPLAMALSVVSGILPHQLALLNLPAVVVLQGILSISHLFANLPLAHLSIKITRFDMFTLYAVFGMVIYAMWRKTRQRLTSEFLI